MTQASWARTLRLGLGLRPLRPSRRRRYICGEETALLESLEGKKGMPRLKAAVPGRRGPLWLPLNGEQQSNRRRRSDHPAPRRQLVLRIGRPNNPARSFLHLRHVNKPCNVDEEGASRCAS